LINDSNNRDYSSGAASGTKSIIKLLNFGETSVMIIAELFSWIVPVVFVSENTEYFHYCNIIEFVLGLKKYHANI